MKFNISQSDADVLKKHKLENGTKVPYKELTVTLASIVNKTININSTILKNISLVNIKNEHQLFNIENTRLFELIHFNILLDYLKFRE